MSKTKDMTTRERLVRAGILLPAPRPPEPEDEVQGVERARVSGSCGRIE